MNEIINEGALAKSFEFENTNGITTTITKINITSNNIPLC